MNLRHFVLKIPFPVALALLCGWAFASFIAWDTDPRAWGAAGRSTAVTVTSLWAIILVGLWNL